MHQQIEGTGIMSDCVPSPESDSSYASSSASCSSSGSSPTCEISLLERLVRTHPVWFLPSLQRSGALHLLQGRDVGNFIVRSSTQPKTMAVSVKLPGNHVEHYLLKANENKISLANSAHTFDSVHQLIAYFIGRISTEIPVRLILPTAIQEATSRQQLTSLALLGQEFWSIPGNVISSKTNDQDISRNFGKSASQSFSTHSLSDVTSRICRPTTLGLESRNQNPPPAVPTRLDSWTRTMSQPSSVQSTPSEVQSTFSEKSGRPGKKKKESIHYKDTEILELFKGTKTLYDDKASDYEDIWSPQHLERSQTPKLSTFKPDIIPTSQTPPEAEQFHLNKNNDGGLQGSSVDKVSDELTVRNINIYNHRLSFNGQNINLNGQNSKSSDILSKSNGDLETTTMSQNDTGGQKSPGLYSEPLDSITLRQKGNRSTTEANGNVRWSQPTLSLLKIDFSSDKLMDECPSNVTGSGEGKPNNMESKSLQQEISTSKLNVGQQAISVSRSNADVSFANKSVVSQAQICTSKSSSNNNLQKNQRDNLCQSRDYAKIPISRMIHPDEEEGKTLSERNDVQILHSREIAPLHRANSKGAIPEIPNKSWNVDNSWELVMWQKEEERRLKENVAKFPAFPSPVNSPVYKRKATPSESSQTENSFSSTNNNNSGNEGSNSLRRFSCYDNLERSKAEINAEVETDSDEDKISPPWDSTKWEHLMKIISDSTQQLDLLSSTSNNNDDVSGRINKNILPILISDLCQDKKNVQAGGGNVDKAFKAVATVVRSLASNEGGVFGPTLKSFITCTINAKIQDPHKVMRNVRQFISGMKNFLVGLNYESEELRKEIKKQTETLSNNEFLNIDAILEEVLVDLVISPLNLHIRGLIESYNASNGEPLHLPTEKTSKYYSELQNNLPKLANVYNGFEDSISPMQKLDKWNEFVCQVQEMDNYSTDSFLPLLSEALGKICSQKLPSHVDYMIGLLPTSLAEQNNYSLSLLQSALSALRVKEEARKGSVSLNSIRVLIPDERNTLIRKMVPVTNSTTIKEVAKIVAHKLGITNPTDYVLVTVKNGEEAVCSDSELVYNCVEEGVIAYKRLDAKIGWPQKIS